MRKIAIIFILTMTALFLNKKAMSQDVATDNDGKPIFVLPSTKKILPEVALNTVGFSYTPFHLKRVKYYVMEGGVKKYTMYKSTTINLKASIIGNDEDVLLIGKDMKVAPHFEIAFNRGIDTLINPSRINKYYTFSAVLFADVQSFDLYDTVNKKFLADKYRRTSIGGRVSYNQFFGTRSALALNLSYSNSIVTDDLTSYQKRSSNELYVDGNIATNGTTDGYLSPVSPVSNWRFSIAYPQFLGGKSRMAIIPYYFVKFGEGLTPKNNAGVLFTILNDKFRNFDKPNGSYDQSARYTFETAFSIGLNLISTGTEKKNYIFLSGTVSFGKSKPKSDIENSRAVANNVF